MSKSKASRTVQIQKDPTRKQLSRAERDAKQRRRVLLSVGGVLLLAVLVLVYGYLRENVLILDEPVANVNGETISTREFQARVRLTRVQAKQQIQRASVLNDQQTANFYQQQLADPNGMGSQVLSQMVDEVLLRQAAPTLSVTVTMTEVQDFIEKDLGYNPNPPTPSPTSTPRPTPTVTGPITQTPTPTFTPRPTPTPITLEGFQQLYRDQINQLATLGFSEQDYRNLIALRLLDDKARQAVASTVPTTTDQIKFRYMRIDTREVPTVTRQVERDGFASVYQSVISGTYPITTVEAAETTDWVPHDEISATTEFGPAVADALFSTPVSSTMSVIGNQAGTASYVAEVIAHAVEPLSTSFLNPRQQGAVEAWLQQRRNPAFFLTWEDRVPTTP